jgi:putative oxidoreductase
MSDKLRDHGLLLLRVGIGASFMAHGWPKLAGGAAKWEKLGGAMKHLGIDFAPTFWGFMAAVSEFFGGLMLAAGVAWLPALAMLAGTMAVASAMHLKKGDSFTEASHALEALVLFVSLALIGPGRFTITGKLAGKG